jgi:hypothetical protein
MLAAHLTARLTASRTCSTLLAAPSLTYQPSSGSETTYGIARQPAPGLEGLEDDHQTSVQRSVANPAFCVVTSPITGRTVPSGHGRSAGPGKVGVCLSAVAGRRQRSHEHGPPAAGHVHGRDGAVVLA